MTEEPPRVRVVDLEKRFKKRRRARELLMPWKQPGEIDALRGVSLEVRGGELVALLGPNGAGKTTLLKILATLVAPSAGRAFVMDAEVEKKKDLARSRIGYVLTEERSFYWRLSVRENLRFFAQVLGTARPVSVQRVRKALAALTS